ncbi:hypothetical protein ACHAWF_011043 [Thalassiosira exigua]
MVKYEDYDWKELPEDAMEAAKKLGYSEKMWDGEKGEPADPIVPCLRVRGFGVVPFMVGRHLKRFPFGASNAIFMYAVALALTL